MRPILLHLLIALSATPASFLWGQADGEIAISKSGRFQSTVVNGALDTRLPTPNLPPDLQNQIVPGTRRATAKWWKMTLLFESEAMCSVACDHVERQRATMRQSKLKDVAAVMEAALTQR